MWNPIKSGEDYIGARPRGRRPTLKEQFKSLSIHSLSRPLGPTSLKWAAIYTIIDALLSLLEGNDLRFSEILLVFVVLLATINLGLRILQAAGHRNNSAGTY